MQWYLPARVGKALPALTGVLQEEQVQIVKRDALLAMRFWLITP